MLASQSMPASAANPPKYPVQASQPGISSKGTISAPKYISMDTTEDAANNILAKGYQHGDFRYQAKQADRAGLSRGKGQQFVAGQQSAQAVTTAANQAAELRAKDLEANQKLRSSYEDAREREAQSLAMSAHGLNQADWNRSFARQSAGAGVWLAQQNALLTLMKALMR